MEIEKNHRIKSLKTNTNMLTFNNKTELENWIKDVVFTDGCAVPIVVNGGGPCCYQCSTIDEDWTFGEDYGSVELVQRGDEMPDWHGEWFDEYAVSDNGIEDFIIYRVKHQTAYNQENFDIEVAVWE